jgi:transposase
MADPSTPRFDLQARERLLALLTVGQSMEEATAAAGTSRTTVARWAARGRVEGAPPEYASFAKQLDAIRAAKADEREEASAEDDEEALRYRPVVTASAAR